MTPVAYDRDRSPLLSRRSALTAIGAVAGVAALAPRVLAQTQPGGIS